jgi:hypothetical protein
MHHSKASAHVCYMLATIEIAMLSVFSQSMSACAHIAYIFHLAYCACSDIDTVVTYMRRMQH